ncbi:hypothetical protein TNCV_773361 [Trichonephila clavipes]|nr:hypothetical protein TNCV_773361 [Trichonephila clavipes]
MVPGAFNLESHRQIILRAPFRIEPYDYQRYVYRRSEQRWHALLTIIPHPSPQLEVIQGNAISFYIQIPLVIICGILTAKRTNSNLAYCKKMWNNVENRRQEMKTYNFNTEVPHLRHWVNRNTLKSLAAVRIQEKCARPCSRGYPTNSWQACHEFEPRTIEDPPCRRVQCTLKMSMLKRPPSLQMEKKYFVCYVSNAISK